MLYYALNIYEHTFSHWTDEKNGFGVRQGFTVCKVLMVLIMIKKSWRIIDDLNHLNEKDKIIKNIFKKVLTIYLIVVVYR